MLRERVKWVWWTDWVREGVSNSCHFLALHIFLSFVFYLTELSKMHMILIFRRRTVQDKIFSLLRRYSSLPPFTWWSCCLSCVVLWTDPHSRSWFEVQWPPGTEFVRISQVNSYISRDCDDSAINIKTGIISRPRPVVTIVKWSVCVWLRLSVGWTDWHAVWNVDSGNPRNDVSK